MTHFYNSIQGLFWKVSAWMQFLRKGQKNVKKTVKKAKIFQNLGKNVYTKLENILKKGDVINCYNRSCYLWGEFHFCISRHQHQIYLPKISKKFMSILTVVGLAGLSKSLEKGKFVTNILFLMLSEVLKNCEKWYILADVKTNVKQ